LRKNFFERHFKRTKRALKAMAVKFEDPSREWTKADEDAIKRVINDMRGKPIYEKLVQIYEKTIKGDRRSIEFLLTHMLSAYTTDPNNLGLEAPTSEGKTYPTVEVAKRSPSDDVWYIGGLSPTALVHDYGELVDDEGNPIEAAIEALRDRIRNLREAGSEGKGDLVIARDELKELLRKSRYVVDMEDKIMIFLEAPCLETWEHLRPILSHDVFEISYKFTDKTSAGSLKTNHVVIRGWPAVIYLKAGRGHEDIIWDEIQSRFTTISPKTGFDKYREAIRHMAMKKGLPGPIFERTLNFEEFRWLEDVLKCLRVRLADIKYKARKICQEVDPNMFWVPFYESIGNEFPAKEGRHMRDSRRFMTLLQMSAAIDCYNRPTLNIGEAEFIVVVREDYERAVRLFFGEAGDEIFSGLPRHVIDFFRKIPLKMFKEGAPITVAEMVKESKKHGKPISDKTMRSRYLPLLENAGLLSSEPDPNDKRQNLWAVLSEEIAPKDIPIYTLFEKGLYFNAQILEQRFVEALKIFRPEEACIKDYDGTPLTAAQLWEKYYSKGTGVLAEYQPTPQTTPTEESGGKIQPISETGVIGHISGENAPKIEGFGKPMNLNNVIKRALKTYKISITTKRRAFLKEAARAFEERCESKNGKTVMALHLGDIKKMIPDIEIYLDEFARLTTPDIIARGITEAIVHETCHAEGLNEKQAHAATREIMKMLKPMVWKLIKCPKTNANVGWEECLRCSDAEKHPTCPGYSIRSRSKPREHAPNIYHITELITPRHAYFERKYDVTKAWADSPVWMRFFMGRAFHEFYEKAYAEHEVEIGVARDYGDFKVTGRIDIISDGLLQELKTHGDLGRVKARGVSPEHVWQAHAYYSLLKVTQPRLANEIKKIRILYAGLTRADTWCEFDVKPKDISDDIYARAKDLHEALKAGVAPEDFPCPEWRCRLCDYASQCKGIKIAEYKKEDKTFEKFLEQHVVGVKKVADILRAQGHTVEVQELAKSDKIISDPAQKQQNEFDILDICHKQKIDVKTTARSDIWCNAAQLTKAADLDLIYYFVFIKSGEVRRIKAKKLHAAQKTAKSDVNQFGEEGFIFDKEVAEAVK